MTVRYSDEILRRASSPARRGRLAGAKHEGCVGDPERGPFMLVQLRVEGDRVAAAAFDTHGCPVCVACGSAVAELAVGRTVSEARDISRARVLDLLGAVPFGKTYCVDMAVDALARALDSPAG